MSRLKEHYTSSIFDYLNKHLSNKTKLKLTSTETMEIVQCMASWAYQTRKNVNYFEPAPKDEGPEPTNDFIEELKKL